MIRTNPRPDLFALEVLSVNKVQTPYAVRDTNTASLTTGLAYSSASVHILYGYSTDVFTGAIQWLNDKQPQSQFQVLVQLKCPISSSIQSQITAPQCFDIYMLLFNLAFLQDIAKAMMKIGFYFNGTTPNIFLSIYLGSFCSIVRYNTSCNWKESFHSLCIVDLGFFYFWGPTVNPIENWLMVPSYRSNSTYYTWYIWLVLTIICLSIIGLEARFMSPSTDVIFLFYDYIKANPRCNA